MISGEEIRIQTYKDVKGAEIQTNLFVYPIKKNNVVYLIPSEFIDKMPLLIEKEEKISFRSKGYRLPLHDNSRFMVKPMRIRPERGMSFRELVDNFANGEHENKEDDLLWRMMTLIAFLDRVNIRVATPPEFGKDSKMNLINAMTGSIGMISNPTIAKLEYMLHNKVLFLNEVSGIGSQSKADIEQFLLQTSDFNNKYTKRSRAGAGSSEEYKIQNLSVVVVYNDIKQYQDESKYFDFMWTNAGAINNRIIPFLFAGKQLVKYKRDFDVDEVVRENWDFYLKWLRALLYYQDNKFEDDKGFPVVDYDFGKNGRWQINFATIQRWIGKYAKDYPEYKKLCDLLYSKHLDYLKMVGLDKSTKDNDWFKVEEEVVR